MLNTRLLEFYGRSSELFRVWASLLRWWFAPRQLIWFRPSPGHETCAADVSRAKPRALATRLHGGAHSRRTGTFCVGLRRVRGYGLPRSCGLEDRVPSKKRAPSRRNATRPFPKKRAPSRRNAVRAKEMRCSSAKRSEQGPAKACGAVSTVVPGLPVGANLQRPPTLTPRLYLTFAVPDSPLRRGAELTRADLRGWSGVPVDTPWGGGELVQAPPGVGCMGGWEGAMLVCDGGGWRRDWAAGRRQWEGRGWRGEGVRTGVRMCSHRAVDGGEVDVVGRVCRCFLQGCIREL